MASETYACEVVDPIHGPGKPRAGYTVTELDDGRAELRWLGELKPGTPPLLPRLGHEPDAPQCSLRGTRVRRFVVEDIQQGGRLYVIRFLD